ncbi:MAG: protoheme IX farnesyltransferase [Ignavibacteriae bacterium]|nr:protoheme IX farnesyltransferase [Ignavibacteriota bacterium]
MNSAAKTLEHPVVHTRPAVLDYLELMKPELTSLSVLTALCGFYLATKGGFNYWLFFHTAVGTLCVGGAAGALNQYIERNYDALMKRTERRPLPSGRLHPRAVLLFGTLLSIVGMFQLRFLVNPLTGFLAFITFTTYLFLYTPLKRMTPLSTLVGGFPGALPPVIGWTAVRNELSIEALILFAILFCWQMPHFFSLAWMYRKDYARAGFKVLPVLDENGTRTSRQILFFCTALIPASLALHYVGTTGLLSAAIALTLGVAFLLSGIALWRCAGRRGPEALGKINFYARRLFFASLLYLPTLLILMSLDKM